MTSRSKRARVNDSSQDADDDVTLPCVKKSTGDNNTNAKPICKYGSSCYRKNPDHLRDFQHPHRENDDNKEEKEEKEKTNEDQVQNKDVEMNRDGNDKEEDKDEDEAEDEEGDDQEAFLTSPDGTEWWNILLSSNNVFTSGGVIGYEGFNTDMEYDDVHQAKAKYTSWLEAKLRSGWSITKDPRTLSSVKEVVFLVADDNPPYWPHKRRWKLSIAGVQLETTTSDGGAMEHTCTFSRWYGTAAEARAQAEEWIRKKKAQGYHQVPEPKILWSRAEWDCSDRGTCPFISHPEHLKYYYHRVGPDLDHSQLEASCHNPVLVEAWNIQQPMYMRAIVEATPSHIKPLANIITEYLQPSFKSCWKPTCVEQKNVPITRSKIGGRPYIPKGEKWPTCGSCSKPLTFIMQLNVSELPSQVACALGDSNHMIQLFICMNDDMCCGESYEAFGPGNLARRCTWAEGGGQTTLVVPPSSISSDLLRDGREKLITGWVEGADRVSATDDWYPQLKTLEGEEDEAFDVWNEGDEAKGIPEAACVGDKLCGFAHFVQDPAYPICPVCQPKNTRSGRLRQKQAQESEEEDGDGDGDSQTKHRMRYVLQIDSESDIVPFMFGDCGIGHIYQCAIHKDILAFSWACS